MILFSKIQGSPFIMLCLWSIGKDSVISDLCYEGEILQRNHRKIATFVQFFCKNIWQPHDIVIAKFVL